MPTNPSLHRALGDPSRVRILDELRVSPRALDAAQLSERIGLHPNTIRSHLRVLAGAGLVTSSAEERHRPGRPRIVYEAVPEGEVQPLSGYRLLAEILASELAGSGEGSVARALEAGRSWGRFLIAREPPASPSSAEEDVEAVIALLDESGFSPTLDPDSEGHTLLMQHCPFGEVADHYRKVVCAVHLGLIQGALAELGAHARADRLDPFVRPGVCAAHLERVGSAS